MGKKSRMKKENNGTSTTGEKRDKKQAVLQSGSKGGKKTITGIVAAALFAAFVAVAVFSGGGFKTVTAEAGMVRIPLSDVNDGQAHFFTYEGRKPVNFFVLRSSDGVIRTAFDACDVCFKEKKGYRQEGDLMVCNNCGQKFPSVKINVMRGGCNPAPLNRAVQGETLVLRASDIESGVFYF
jgi:uncharacterized membrane protein